MEERTIVIPGEPQGKDRPRFSKIGHAYTTKRTADYERLIRRTYREQYPSDSASAEEPVIVEILACFSVPRGESRKKRIAKLSGDILPTKKPDCDNIAKVICDALNGLAYADDKQIVRCTVAKQYEEDAHVLVHVRTLEGQGTDTLDCADKTRC